MDIQRTKTGHCPSEKIKKKTDRFDERSACWKDHDRVGCKGKDVCV